MPFKRVQKFSKPTHGIGVQLAVPHSRFVPTPNMTPLQIAFNKGAEAKVLGRPNENPHTDKLSPNDGQLAAAWDKGYNS
jgi:hypothetical protein